MSPTATALPWKQRSISTACGRAGQVRAGGRPLTRPGQQERQLVNEQLSWKFNDDLTADKRLFALGAVATVAVIMTMMMMMMMGVLLDVICVFVCVVFPRCRQVSASLTRSAFRSCNTATTRAVHSFTTWRLRIASGSIHHYQSSLSSLMSCRRARQSHASSQAAA